MNLAIRKNGRNIETFTDFTQIDDRGEISHFICQLELIKQKLLELWDDYDKEEESEEDD